MTKPIAIDPLADNVLRRLSTSPEASEVVLGGYMMTAERCWGLWALKNPGDAGE